MLYGMSNCVSTAGWNQQALGISPDPRFLSLELKTWPKKWEIYSESALLTLSEFLSYIDKLSFPYLHTAFRIAATLPVLVEDLFQLLDG